MARFWDVNDAVMMMMMMMMTSFLEVLLNPDTVLRSVVGKMFGQARNAIILNSSFVARGK
jgi:hypothetical protein